MKIKQLSNVEYRISGIPENFLGRLYSMQVITPRSVTVTRKFFDGYSIDTYLSISDLSLLKTLAKDLLLDDSDAKLETAYAVCDNSGSVDSVYLNDTAARSRAAKLNATECSAHGRERAYRVKETRLDSKSMEEISAPPRNYRVWFARDSVKKELQVIDYVYTYEDIRGIELYGQIKRRTDAEARDIYTVVVPDLYPAVIEMAVKLSWNKVKEKSFTYDEYAEYEWIPDADEED